jgi:hypothetical protein
MIGSERAGQDERRSVQMRPPQGHGQKRTRREERAIIALLEADTIAEAAVRSRVSKSTLMRWLADADFQTAYRAARQQLLSGAVNRLRRIARGAGVDVLESIARDKKAPTAARVSAAGRILDAALKAAETQDLIERVDALEHKFGRQK